MAPRRHTREQVEEAILWRAKMRPFVLTAVEALRCADAMPLSVERSRAMRALGAAEGVLEALDVSVTELSAALAAVSA